MGILTETQTIIAIVAGGIGAIIAFIRLEGKLKAQEREIGDLREDTKGQAIENKTLSSRIGSVENVMIRDMSELKNLFVKGFSDLRVQLAEHGYKQKEEK